MTEADIPEGSSPRQGVQRQATTSRAWNSLPLEIRQNIIHQYLVSSLECNDIEPLVLVAPKLDRATLSVLVAISYSFGQQDVLHPLCGLRRIAYDTKEDKLAEYSEIVKVFGVLSEIFVGALRAAEEQLDFVDQAIAELSRQRVRTYDATQLHTQRPASLIRHGRLIVRRMTQ